MKARSEATELNLDSLMDTITNVVGILVLILVLVTLNIKKSVDRIREEDPSQFGISKVQLAEIQEMAKQHRQLIEQLEIQTEDLDIEMEQDEAEIVEQQEVIEELSQEPPPDIETLAMEQKKKEEELEEIKKELASVEGELGETRDMTAPPPKIVRLPNPRNAPEGAEPILFLCREGRLMVFDPEGLKSRVEKRVGYLMRPLVSKATSDGEIDCQKLVASYNKNPLDDDQFRTKLVIQNYRLVLIYEHKGAGETPERLRGSSSRFQASVRRMGTQNNYARFLVWPDSFDVYVEARSICDERGVLAGWQPCTEDYQWKITLGIKVTCEGKPKPKPKPPPDKSAPKKPAAPPPPPLPNDVID